MKWLNVVFALLLVLVLSETSSAQDKVKKEDWTNEMGALGGQQTDLQHQIDSLNTAIKTLGDEGSGYDKETEQLWNEIYAAVGTDKAKVDELKAKLTELEGRINEYAKLADETLSQKIPELEALKTEVDTYKKDRRYALSEIFNKVNDLSNRCDQLIQRGKNYQPPKPRNDTYVVTSGDYLWRISGKSDIYSDPFQWMKIYSANRDQIKNPDLIFPRQSFIIPRAQDANEYWVERGDNLKLISQKVYGSPASWVKIYNANKGIIGEDASRIYPYTILIVPKE